MSTSSALLSPLSPPLPFGTIPSILPTFSSLYLFSFILTTLTGLPPTLAPSELGIFPLGNHVSPLPLGSPWSVLLGCSTHGEGREMVSNGEGGMVS